MGEICVRVVVAPPRAFEDPALSRGRSLLELARGSVRAERALEFFKGLLPDPLGPQQLALLPSRVARPGERVVGLVFGGQAQVFEASLFDEVLQS